MKQIDTDDVIKVKLASNVASLMTEDSNTKDIADNIMGESKSLIVTFDLSHSAKQINSRIYPPRAQERYVSTWRDMPVLKHHNTDEDAIGRIIDVKYVSLEKEARQFLGDVGYAEVKAAFDSNDRERIHRVFNQYNLNSSEWEGLGKLVATARISDRDAIQKFLDQRYLTFSGGARINGICCTKCGKNPNKCEHSAGVKTEDGDVPWLLTGSMYEGREASVVNVPADKKAKVLHMVFDSEDGTEIQEDMEVDWDDALITVDSIIELPEIKTEDTQANTEVQSTESITPFVVVQDQILAGLQAVADAVQSIQDEEPDWFVLDLALNSMLAEDDKLSSEKREALSDDTFCGPDRSFPVPDCAHVTAARKLIGRYKGPGSKEKILACVNSKAEKLKCDSESSDHKCEQCSKDYEKLQARLVELQTVVDSYGTIKEDYARALKTIEETEKMLKLLDTSLNTIAENKNISDFIDKSLDEKAQWFATIATNKKVILTVDDIEVIENPGTTENQLEDKDKALNGLSAFERTIVTRYKQLIDFNDSVTANSYLQQMRRRGHISNHFDVLKYI